MIKYDPLLRKMVTVFAVSEAAPAGALTKKSFTANGATTDFDTTGTMDLNANVQVFVNGILLVADYTRAGNVISINPAPLDGSIITIFN
jgi:hypothetical protein